MAVPWLRIIDSVLGISDVVRAAKGRPAAQEERDLAGVPRGSGAAGGPLEARLAGVVVAALKEAFDRDHQRLELERQQMAEERARAERALRLELLRQAGDRELGRLRLLAAVAVASWLGTLFFATRLVAGALGGRIALGAGWVLLLAALGSAFSGQSRVARALGAIDDRTQTADVTAAGAAGAIAPWLIVAGLAVIAFGVLLGRAG
jgi:hypothetical protein